MNVSHSPWAVAWCFERCYKSDNDEYRSLLADAVRGGRGQLKCLKKARHFAHWMEQQEARACPYALLVDWREAKPCCDALVEMKVGHKPSLIVVTCDSAIQAARAQAWARRLAGGAGRVEVCQRDISCLQDLVRSIMTNLQSLGPYTEKHLAGSPVQQLIMPYTQMERSEIQCVVGTGGGLWETSEMDEPLVNRLGGPCFGLPMTCYDDQARLGMWERAFSDCSTASTQEQRSSWDFPNMSPDVQVVHLSF
mmetsp:Transcript_123564/g.395247  ORF Transcript_123564/g.395247 Transcript_123564/m.395247 type:complete len:251 (+) Transcript_123564:130-882(+)